MKHLVVCLAMALAVAGLVGAGCSQAAPAPTQAPAAPPKAAEPTKAPAAAPTKPAEPTKAPAATTAAPTTAPAKKTAFPEKGKSLTIIVPWAAGSVNDVLSRLVATYLEKELGIPVQVVDKPGAGSQIGITDLAKAPPDGYTLGFNSLPTTAVLYTDAERKAVFTRKDLEPVAVVVEDPMVLASKGDGPYKTTKDLVEAARANPEKIKVGDSGVMTSSHNLTLTLGKVAGVKFASVHFTGSTEVATSVIGGHTDAYAGSATDSLPHIRSGAMTALGMTGAEEIRQLPGIKPLKAQGYDVVMTLSRGFAAPGGTPKEILGILSAAIKKVAENEEFKKKVDEAGMVLKYMDVPQYTAHWDEQDKQVKFMFETAAAAGAK